MKIGLLAYSTDTGLGNQTYEFYKHMKPDKVLIADLSKLNGVKTHHERYFEDGQTVVDGVSRRIDPCESKNYLSNESCEWLVEGMDAIFVCETPLSYYLYQHARDKGVKTIQQYNYEFLDYFRNPLLPKPTVLAAPTMWGMQKVKELNVAPVMQWRVPVNRESNPYREIEECKTFVHIVGRPAANDRNGTIAFLDAAKKLGKDFNYKIYIQEPTDSRSMTNYNILDNAIRDAQRKVLIEVIKDVPNYADMYASGDVLVLPRKYGGLCLPMQEALSAGMPVIMTDIDPNNHLLPNEWLCNTLNEGSFVAHTKIYLHAADVGSLSRTMGKFADKAFMRKANRKANMLAEMISWNRMATLYTEWMEEVIKL